MSRSEPCSSTSRTSPSPSDILDRSPLQKWRFAARAALLTSAFAAVNYAQDTTESAPPPAPSLPAPVANFESSPEVRDVETGGGFSTFDTTPPQIPKRLLLQVAYEYSRAEGVQARPGVFGETTLQSFTPTIQVLLSERWKVGYSPTWTYYSDENFKDSVEHALQLTGSAAYYNWQFSFLQTYASSSSLLVETGEQTDTERYNTKVGATLELNSRTLLQFGLLQHLRLTERFTDSREWSLPAWIRYQLAPGLEGGFGLSVGYVDVDPGPNMSYQTAQVQLAGQPLPKLGWTIHGGFENRNVDAPGVEDMQNPLYGGSVRWDPTEVTAVTISGQRQYTTSLLRGLVADRTDIDLRVQQRLLQHLLLTLRAAHYDVDYVATSPDAMANNLPEDLAYDRTRYSAQLTTVLFGNTRLSAVYARSKTYSGRLDFDYWSTQYGFEVRYRF